MTPGAKGVQVALLVVSGLLLERGSIKSETAKYLENNAGSSEIHSVVTFL